MRDGASTTGSAEVGPTGERVDLTAERVDLTAERKDVLRRWQRGIRILHVGHGIAGEHFDTRARTVGVSSAVLSAIVGTAIFASLNQSTRLPLRTVTAVLGLLAAGLSTAQAICNYPQLSQKHKDAMTKYGSLRRTVECLLLAPAVSAADLDDVSATWKRIEENTLPLSARFRRRTHRAMRRLDGPAEPTATDRVVPDPGT